jgi:hypothetical protein
MFFMFWWLCVTLSGWVLGKWANACFVVFDAAVLVLCFSDELPHLQRSKMGFLHPLKNVHLPGFFADGMRCYLI